MNELIELTRFREPVAGEPDPAALAHARKRLVKHLRKRPSGIHMLTPRRLAIAAAVAVAAAAGVVVDALMIGDQPLSASAEAADLLRRAADQAIGAADPEVGPDAYLHVTTVAVYGSGAGEDHDAGPSRDGEALVLIADVLRSGIVPGDLRAALFRAAALIPGVEVVDRQANLNGEVGVAVGRYEPNSGDRQEIIFNPETGMVIGEREVRVDPGHPLSPAGSLISWTAVTTDVVPAAEVDQIPADPLD
jgi:hypothetical protein